MNEQELIKLIQSVLRQEIAKIMMGEIEENESELKVSFTRYSGEAPITKARHIQPFGLSSKAPKKTECLSIPIGGNPTNQSIVGHYDKNKPTLNDGETILYDAYGHLIVLSESKMQIGSKNSDEPLVLGKIFKAYEKKLLDNIMAIKHVDGMGMLTTVPVNSADFLAQKADTIDSNKILSDKVFTEK